MLKHEEEFFNLNDENIQPAPYMLRLETGQIKNLNARINLTDSRLIQNELEKDFMLFDRYVWRFALLTCVFALILVAYLIPKPL